MSDTRSVSTGAPGGQHQAYSQHHHAHHHHSANGPRVDSASLSPTPSDSSSSFPLTRLPAIMSPSHHQPPNLPAYPPQPAEPIFPNRVPYSRAPYASPAQYSGNGRHPVPSRPGQSPSGPALPVTLPPLSRNAPRNPSVKSEDEDPRLDIAVDESEGESVWSHELGRYVRHPPQGRGRDTEDWYDRKARVRFHRALYI